MVLECFYCKQQKMIDGFEYLCAQYWAELYLTHCGNLLTQTNLHNYTSNTDLRLGSHLCRCGNAGKFHVFSHLQPYAKCGALKKTCGGAISFQWHPHALKKISPFAVSCAQKCIVQNHHQVSMQPHLKKGAGTFSLQETLRYSNLWEGLSKIKRPTTKPKGGLYHEFTLKLHCKRENKRHQALLIARSPV